MSWVMKPLETPVGVVQMVLGPTRQLMLPSLDATKPLAYIRRPISRIAFFASKSDLYFMP